MCPCLLRAARESSLKNYFLASDINIPRSARVISSIGCLLGTLAADNGPCVRNLPLIKKELSILTLTHFFFITLRWCKKVFFSSFSRFLLLALVHVANISSQNGHFMEMERENEKCIID
jgi:hypothetical protein